MSNENACTLLCAGAAVYAPMVRSGVQPGSVVGVLGMGGVGHLAVLFSKAMRARVVSLSRGEKKRDVCIELGCDDYVNIDDAKDMARITKSLTHIVGTGYSEDFKFEPFFMCLKANGVFISVALPGHNLPSVHPFLFSCSQVSIVGSLLYSSAENKDMLEFASKHQIKSWITKYPMKEINQALKDFDAGLPRFRIVLEN